ncbi:hypothetical protein A2572_01300 [Candidatus Collierbacteria bacterium RIFOXYD1_FULL_40_9]|uniref:Uncharacterized protein n=1 Tax=Candidatus Collierbacteria bacterium RIFOXYD1_FULL_40_9 TaxID=1817731 RepID=A0A1F5FVK6_9BACT|nr:MAG: hypothetical protein A2572_01300 [Candidatus Collierbacteria bacterium RIFOXYD1_FULL_40_9]
MIPVIICGGVGTKMWPMSTPNTPKHFLPLVDSESLFQINWRVLRKWFSPEEIYVQTNAHQARIAHHQVSEIVPENIFIEPETRNQGPATGLAAANLIKAGKGDEVFMLIQVDDLRMPEDNLISFMRMAERQSMNTDKYVTSGFSPKWHQGGVDYLLKGKLVEEKDGVKIFEVDDFVDRSETDRISENIGKDRLLVHTNHSTMTANKLMSYYRDYKSDWYSLLTRFIQGEDIEEIYPQMEKGQLEMVTKELYKKKRALVIENNFEWIDFGTWEAVSKYYDERGITHGVSGTIELESKNNFLWSQSGKTIATIGLDDIVVIESEEGILVSKKEKTGLVSLVTEKISSGDI